MPRLLVIGSSNWDMALHLPRLPRPGQTILGGALEAGLGGKGANQAVAAARAGASVVFVSAVGDDHLGRKALDGYRDEGIVLDHLKISEGSPSGVALIFVGDDGENMIGVAPGANSELYADDIDELPDDLFVKGRVLLLAGLEIPLESVGRAAARASKAGMRVILNPAPATAGLADAIDLKSIDVITPNRGELHLLTDIATDSEDGLHRAVSLLRSMGPKHIVVTLGSEGCLVQSSDESRPIPARRVKVVDAVGAGDAFNGAFAVALAEGKSVIVAAHWASAASALAVTKPGAQSALPTRDEIDRFASSPVV